ncbi:MAG: beta-ketoacyl synthase chain length factor [Gammaproteobacteria bacterium]|nr:beta-ketoacyl synthase chain length factor [Gammaproteobacteria bacterium]
MKPVYVDAVGLAGPGLPNWVEAVPVFSGNAVYKSEPLARYRPKLLPANERRRATDIIRLAFQAGEDAVSSNKNFDLSQIASVFASSGGDLDIIDNICRVFAGPDRAVSPTQFHNSVHNSAAGYWSIATGSQAPSSSLSACDHTFSAGLVEAVMFATVEAIPTLLVVYDISAPVPLLDKVLKNRTFGTAFLLSPVQSAFSCASLTVALVSELRDESKALSSELEMLRNDNPAAKAIPLLELLARKEGGLLTFSSPGSQYIDVKVVPC